MALFIGRNIEEASKVWLNNQQINYVAEPLIDIELIAPDYHLFQKIAAYNKNWLITSKWAAMWFKFYFNELSFNSADSVFCLSEKQAQIIAEYSKSIYIADKPNVKSLSELVQQKASGKLNVCLKGNCSLAATGFEFVDVEVYQNHALQATISGRYSVYVFFSPSGIVSFLQGGNRISENAIVVAIGETTAQKARSSFQNQVLVSKKQNELYTIQTAVKHLQEKSENV
jgi:uroporphyrinogen-III synthase